ncbi:MAG: hypothetical protein GQ531_00905, partial [Sulfurovum sp.]|nr:hypothetical protein [Sulfurovum sp.]
FAGGDVVPPEPMVEEVSEWSTSASIYMWAAGISGETARGDEIDISFSDILDNFKMAFMGNVAAQKGKWGVESDIVYMHLGNDIDRSFLLQDFSFKAWIITPMVTYAFLEDDHLTLKGLAGTRYLYMKPRVNNRETSGNNWDAIVGIKGDYAFNEKWFMPFHFDVGTGETDVTWQAFAGVGYKYESFDLMAGYRYLEWNFDENDQGGKIFNDLTISGPVIGAKFRF